MRRLMRSQKARMGLGVTALALVLGGGAGAYTLKTKETPMAAVQRLAQTAQTQSLYASARTGMAVRDILVEGRNRTEAEHLLVALNVRRGDPILGVDLTEAIARVQALPWIKAATIERRLPDTLSLTIVEREPAALWQDGTAHRLIDPDGVVIPVNVAPFAALPVITGNGAPQQVRELLALNAAHPSIAARLNAAVWVSGRRWNLHLTVRTAEGEDAAVVVRLPDSDADGALTRLERLEREHALLQRAVNMIDLRFSDRLVVRTPDDVEPAQDGTPATDKAKTDKPKLPALKGERKA